MGFPGPKGANVSNTLPFTLLHVVLPPSLGEGWLLDS